MRLTDIARVCRANGITSYDDGKLKLVFGPPPLPAPRAADLAQATEAKETVEAGKRSKARPNMLDLALSDEWGGA